MMALAVDVTPLVEKVEVPAALALLTLLGSVWLALYNRSSGVTDRRRASYAGAVSTLVAWIEYPYRIRRRTSDSSEELARLATLGHDLQERLRCHQTWIGADSREVGELWDACFLAIGHLVRPACQRAWGEGPVTSGTDMNIGDWGPGHRAYEYVDALQKAISWRFSRLRPLTATWRRLRGRPAVVRLLPQTWPRRTPAAEDAEPVAPVQSSAERSVGAP